jgi:hypothetical protein
MQRQLGIASSIVYVSTVAILGLPVSCSSSTFSQASSIDQGEAGAGDAGDDQGPTDSRAPTGESSVDAPSSEGPILISQSSKTTFEAETHLVAGSDGKLLAVWMGFPQGSLLNGYARSDDDGRTWSAPMSAPGSSFGDPVATRGADGSFYYGYLDGICGAAEACSNGHVWVARMAPSSTTFGARVDVSPADPTEFYDKPWMMTASDGTLLVTFNGTVGQSPNNVASIVVARSSDGTSWTRAYAVPKQARGVLAQVPHACTSPTGSRMWIAYIDSTSPIYASIRWSDDLGLTWPNANVSSGFALPSEAAALQSYDLRCVGRDDDVWLLYGLASGSSSASAIPPLDEIHVAHSSDGGKTWPKRTVIQETGLQYLRPEIVLEPSGAIDLIAYTGAKEGDANGRVRAWRSTDAAASFAPLTTLVQPIRFTGDRSGSAWIGDYGGLAFASGEILATVVDNSSGSSHIAFARATVP